MYHHSILWLLHLLIQFSLFSLLSSSIKILLTVVKVLWAELEAQLVDGEIVLASMVL